MTPPITPPDGSYLEFQGRRYRGALQPGGRTAVLVSPEQVEGFTPRVVGGGWSREVPSSEVVRVTTRTTCSWRGEPFQVLTTDGDLLVLRHLGGSRRAREMGLTEVERGVFNTTLLRSEVTDLEQVSTRL